MFVAYARNLLARYVASGALVRRENVKRFAALRAIQMAILANLLNFVVRGTMDAAGILPGAFHEAITTSLVPTTIIAAILSFAAFYVIGLAIHDLTVSRDEFERLSRTDMLSGLPNRRAFVEAFGRAAGETSLLLFDVDRFKTINDTHGHHNGDRVIIAIAGALAEMLGTERAVARIGGEEFAALLESPGRDAAFEMAERVRRTISELPISTEDGRRLFVTVSVGVADRADHDTFASLFSAADRALYLAKSSGRNRSVHAHDLKPLGPRAERTAPDEPPMHTAPRRSGLG